MTEIQRKPIFRTKRHRIETQRKFRNQEIRFLLVENSELSFWRKIYVNENFGTENEILNKIGFYFRDF